MRALLFSFVVLFLCNCAAVEPFEAGDGVDEEGEGPSTSASGVDDKADTTERRVRAGDLSLWIDRVAAIGVEDEEPVVVVRGRVSRPLVSARAWVPDDSFGTTTVVGPRSFEIALRGGHEVNTVLSGLSLFVSLEVGSGTHRSYDARIDLEPALHSFRGHPDVRVDSVMKAVYVGGGDSLRYRAFADVDAADLTVGDAGSPSFTSLAINRAAIDFTYADLAGVYVGGRPIIFQDDDGHQKRARLGVRIAEIGLTLEDPRSVWPGVCEPGVWTCAAESAGGPTLADCGSYRQVQRCVGTDVCEVFADAPLSLTELDLSFAFRRGLDEFADHCDDASGQWCSFSGLTTFMTPECMSEPPALREIVAAVAARNLPFGGVDLAGARFEDGVVLDRAAVMATPFFSTSYSSGGDAFFRGVDAHMAGGPLEGWQLSSPIACHNCTQLEDVLVLWYPEAFRVVVIEGGHGYDS